MQDLHVNGKLLRVIRSFIPGPGKIPIMETDSGFCYLNGDMVSDRGHLGSLPRIHRDRAIAWFDKIYGEKTRRAESVGNVLEEIKPIEETKDEGILALPELVEEIDRV